MQMCSARCACVLLAPCWGIPSPVRVSQALGRTAATAALLQFVVNSVLELSLVAVPPDSLASPAESPGKTEVNALRDRAVQQHGLPSASVAACASSYLSEAAGGTARL